MNWTVVVWLVALVATPAVAERVFYVGSGHKTVLSDALTLSDGTVLIAGGTDSLAWVSRGTPMVALKGDAITSQAGGGRLGFILHVSADLEKLLRVVHLPPGAADDIRRLRVSSVPGEKTGDLFISGTTKEDRPANGGYFIAKLDGNFVTAAPKSLKWVRNVWAGGSHRDLQPWDVGSDGKVAYIIGKEYSPDWVSLNRLTPEGRDDIVPNWRYHWGQGKEGRVEGYWVPATSRKDVKLEGSAVCFKISRPDLRSWTDEDYKLTADDGNGKPRQGRWPNDYFFSGPASSDGGESAKPPGYTGYRPGKNPTHRVGSVMIDRRDNSMYAGFSVQSRLPKGEPDFEPAVIAWDADGTMRWWSRLYHETNDNSTPDQYVDAMAIDYANSRLIVGARAHGNNVINLWSSSNSYKKSLNGKTGNVHISWLGALELKTGKFVNSAWVSELADTTKALGKPIAEGPLAGWPDPNGGWADMNTTRLRALSVDGKGNVLVTAVGRRPVTTVNAYQQMLKPNEGASAWSEFMRVYEPSFSGVSYSSIINAPWDKDTGKGSPSPELEGIAPTASGFIAVGKHSAKPGETIAPVPTAKPPTWGDTDPTEAGLLVFIQPK
jgi:hypothetical protein